MGTPTTWNVTLTRTAPVPSGGSDISLVCRLFTGAGGGTPPAINAEWLGSATSDTLRDNTAVMAVGESTATCTFTGIVYSATIGSTRPQVQVFESGDVTKPLFVTPVQGPTFAVYGVGCSAPTTGFCSTTGGNGAVAYRTDCDNDYALDWVCMDNLGYRSTVRSSSGCQVAGGAGAAAAPIADCPVAFNPFPIIISQVTVAPTPIVANQPTTWSFVVGRAPGFPLDYIDFEVVLWVGEGPEPQIPADFRAAAAASSPYIRVKSAAINQGASMTSDTLPPYTYANAGAVRFAKVQVLKYADSISMLAGGTYVTGDYTVASSSGGTGGGTGGTSSTTADDPTISLSFIRTGPIPLTANPTPGDFVTFSAMLSQQASTSGASGSAKDVYVSFQDGDVPNGPESPRQHITLPGDGSTPAAPNVFIPTRLYSTPGTKTAMVRVYSQPGSGGNLLKSAAVTFTVDTYAGFDTSLAVKLGHVVAAAGEGIDSSATFVNVTQGVSVAFDAQIQCNGTAGAADRTLYWSLYDSDMQEESRAAVTVTPQPDGAALVGIPNLTSRMYGSPGGRNVVLRLWDSAALNSGTLLAMSSAVYVWVPPPPVVPSTGGGGSGGLLEVVNMDLSPTTPSAQLPASWTITIQRSSSSSTATTGSTSSIYFDAVLYVGEGPAPSTPADFRAQLQASSSNSAYVRLIGGVVLAASQTTVTVTFGNVVYPYATFDRSPRLQLLQPGSTASLLPSALQYYSPGSTFNVGANPGSDTSISLTLTRGGGTSAANPTTAEPVTFSATILRCCDGASKTVYWTLVDGDSGGGAPELAPRVAVTLPGYSSAAAAQPTTLNVPARLYGVPGTKLVELRVYDAATGGNLLRTAMYTLMVDGYSAFDGVCAASLATSLNPSSLGSLAIGTSVPLAASVSCSGSSGTQRTVYYSIFDSDTWTEVRTAFDLPADGTMRGIPNVAARAYSSDGGRNIVLRIWDSASGGILLATSMLPVYVAPPSAPTVPATTDGDDPNLAVTLVRTNTAAAPTVADTVGFVATVGLVAAQLTDRAVWVAFADGEAPESSLRTYVLLPAGSTDAVAVSVPARMYNVAGGKTATLRVYGAASGSTLLKSVNLTLTVSPAPGLDPTCSVALTRSGLADVSPGTVVTFAASVTCGTVGGGTGTPRSLYWSLYDTDMGTEARAAILVPDNGTPADFTTVLLTRTYGSAGTYPVALRLWISAAQTGGPLLVGMSTPVYITVQPSSTSGGSTGGGGSTAVEDPNLMATLARLYAGSTATSTTVADVVGFSASVSMVAGSQATDRAVWVAFADGEAPESSPRTQLTLPASGAALNVPIPDRMYNVAGGKTATLRVYGAASGGTLLKSVNVTLTVSSATGLDASCTATLARSSSGSTVAGDVSVGVAVPFTGTVSCSGGTGTPRSLYWSLYDTDMGPEVRNFISVSTDGIVVALPAAVLSRTYGSAGMHTVVLRLWSSPDMTDRLLVALSVPVPVSVVSGTGGTTTPGDDPDIFLTLTRTSAAGPTVADLVEFSASISLSSTLAAGRSVWLAFVDGDVSNAAESSPRMYKTISVPSTGSVPVVVGIPGRMYSTPGVKTAWVRLYDSATGGMLLKSASVTVNVASAPGLDTSCTASLARTGPTPNADVSPGTPVNFTASVTCGTGGAVGAQHVLYWSVYDTDMGSAEVRIQITVPDDGTSVPVDGPSLSRTYGTIGGRNVMLRMWSSSAVTNRALVAISGPAYVSVSGS
ncbi:hypothetical protein HXX76_008159 [Chlamydomonas incerta]|uniref:Ig-like domain-containing protein n=1 Tax=Chlamydomonas incerta TaxID=51695 RepID=A0A835SXY0_CHLIN|nr:hypothetical protein HXX76_008159 [Chlamydomonas incerta]|eukprot:KAG2433801.1 hypothetical protein HXX76_008159 [Chlamydomonas incerta]